MSTPNNEDLATKADLWNVAMDPGDADSPIVPATKADIAELKTELKTDIAGVRTEIERMGRVIIMWMVGIALGACAAMTAIFIALIRAMVPGA
jgi:hypothetical protein